MRNDVINMSRACDREKKTESLWPSVHRSDALTTEPRRARDELPALYTRFLCPVLVVCWSHHFPFFHRALNIPSLFITHMTIVFYPPRHESFLAQWLDHLTRVEKVIISIPVGHSDFFSFFLLISCWLHHVIFHQRFSSGVLRGTQRLFSVKYLFGEANMAQNFLLLEYG